VNSVTGISPEETAKKSQWTRNSESPFSVLEKRKEKRKNVAYTVDGKIKSRSQIGNSLKR
jgi:hypothetical protein